MGQGIPWTRVVAEGLAIVVSILLAFAIQAWWEGRGQSDRRLALLLGLEADFELAAHRLDSADIFTKRGSDAAARWLALSRSGSPGEDLIEVADTILTEVLFAGQFNPPTGTLDALLNGGELELLQNPELVRELTAWPAVVQILNREEDQFESLFIAYISPYLVRAGVYPDLMWYPEANALNSSDYPITPRHTDGYLLLRDEVWEGWVASLWWGHREIRNKSVPVRASLDRIRTLLDQELGTLR